MPTPFLRNCWSQSMWKRMPVQLSKYLIDLPPEITFLGKTFCYGEKLSLGITTKIYCRFDQESLILKNLPLTALILHPIRLQGPGRRCGMGRRIPWSTCGPWWGGPWGLSTGWARARPAVCSETRWTWPTLSTPPPSLTPSGSKLPGKLLISMLIKRLLGLQKISHIISVLLSYSSLVLLLQYLRPI